jgi:hypothetical protein
VGERREKERQRDRDREKAKQDIAFKIMSSIYHSRNQKQEFQTNIRKTINTLLNFNLWYPHPTPSCTPPETKVTVPT